MTLFVPEPAFAVLAPTRGVVRRGGRLELSRVQGHGVTNLRWLAPWLQRLVVAMWNALPRTTTWYLANRHHLLERQAGRQPLARAYVAAVPIVVLATGIAVAALGGGS